MTIITTMIYSFMMKRLRKNKDIKYKIRKLQRLFQMHEIRKIIREEIERENIKRMIDELKYLSGGTEYLNVKDRFEKLNYS